MSCSRAVLSRAVRHVTDGARGDGCNCNVWLQLFGLAGRGLAVGLGAKQGRQARRRAGSSPGGGPLEGDGDCARCPATENF